MRMAVKKYKLPQTYSHRPVSTFWFQPPSTVEHKLGVIRTLNHGADSIVTNEIEKDNEQRHIHRSLQKGGILSGPLRGSPTRRTLKLRTSNNLSRKIKPLVVLPYIKGTSEALIRIFASYNTRTCKYIQV